MSFTFLFALFDVCSALDSELTALHAQHSTLQTSFSAAHTQCATLERANDNLQERERKSEAKINALEYV
jgi:hypothetical protein